MNPILRLALGTRLSRATSERSNPLLMRAIEAGNSEKVIRESYLNTSAFSAAKQFWKLEPQATEESRGSFGRSYQNE